MMLATKFIVAAVRAQTLSGLMCRYVYDLKRGLPITNEQAAQIDWQAQRLRSACEKALGTRGRVYDAAP